MTRHAVGQIPSYQTAPGLLDLSDQDTATKGLKDFPVSMYRASIFLSRHKICLETGGPRTPKIVYT